MAVTPLLSNHAAANLQSGVPKKGKEVGLWLQDLGSVNMYWMKSWIGNLSLFQDGLTILNLKSNHIKAQRVSSFFVVQHISKPHGES